MQSGWEPKIGQVFQKTFWQFLKHIKAKVPSDPDVQFLGVEPKGVKTCPHKTACLNLQSSVHISQALKANQCLPAE